MMPQVDSQASAPLGPEVKGLEAESLKLKGRGGERESEMEIARALHCSADFDAEWFWRAYVNPHNGRLKHS